MRTGTQRTAVAAYPETMGTHVLHDGRRVTIREIRADDGERLRASHARLSPESRYRRFLAAKPELTTADARYLVEIDGSDHVALVATLPPAVDPEEPIVAVARYIRTLGDPDVAEFAIVVGDAYQRQGLGRALTRCLAAAAVSRRIRRFRATMLADNVAIHQLLEALAAGPARRTRTGTISELEIDLPAGDAATVVALPRRAAEVSGSTERGAPAIIAACAGR